MTALIAKTKGEAKALRKMIRNSPRAFDSLEPGAPTAVSYEDTAVLCTKDNFGDVLRLDTLGVKDLWPAEVLEEQWEREYAKRFVERLPVNLADNQKRVREFAAKLAEDPTRLLGNNDDVLRSAARAAVFYDLVFWHGNASKEEGYDDLAWYRTVVKAATDKVLREASSFGWSTSPTSSIGERAKLEAWTRIARRDYLFGF